MSVVAVTLAATLFIQLGYFLWKLSADRRPASIGAPTAWASCRATVADARWLGPAAEGWTLMPDYPTRVGQVLASMASFFPTFRDACHLDTVVFDVALRVDGNAAVDTILIEINPWIPETQPCLFSWETGGDFDCSLRYIRINQGQQENVRRFFDSVEYSR